MSFSGTVKEELAMQISSARHCQLAELAGVVFCCGGVYWEETKCNKLEIYTENEAIARKYFTLLRKTFIFLSQSYTHMHWDCASHWGGEGKRKGLQQRQKALSCQLQHSPLTFPGLVLGPPP